MRKSILSVLVLSLCAVTFLACNKNKNAAMTINPYLTATVNGMDTFVAATVTPSTIDTQTNDTATALVITANSTYEYSFTDQIILAVTDYKGKPGVFSIVQGQAEAAYYHESTTDPASSGIVAITQVTANSIIGYFQFSTVGGRAITNGSFSVGKP